MKYVKSKYNYLHVDQNGNLLMCNFVQGSKSFLKIDREDVAEFQELFKASELYDEHTLNDCYKELIEKGYYIKDTDDELLNIRTLYYDSTMAPLLSLTLMPTEQCNFRCRYCYEKFEKGKMTASAQNSLLKYIQKQIVNNAHIHISWFGGEPLLAFDVIENIMSNVQQMCRMRKRHFTSNMTTNAYLLTIDKFEKLYNYGITAYQITLDGMREDHDKQRCLANGDGTFDRIVENLLAIKNHSEFRFATITIRVNITGNNVKKLNDFLEYYKSLFGDDKRFNIRFAMTGDYGGDRITDFKSNILDGNLIQAELSNTGVYNSADVKVADVLNNFEPMNKVCYTTGKNTFTIGSDLSVYRCTIYFDNPNNRLGTINSDGELQIDKSLNNRWYIKDEVFPDECRECFYFPCCYRTYCPLKLNFIKGFKCEIDTIKNQISKDMEYLDCNNYFKLLVI